MLICQMIGMEEVLSSFNDVTESYINVSAGFNIVSSISCELSCSKYFLTQSKAYILYFFVAHHIDDVQTAHVFCSSDIACVDYLLSHNERCMTVQ